MEYNSSREILRNREYGRNIQKMVDFCLTIENKDERTKFAELIIKVMGQMSPATTDSGNLNKKLWNHLYYMSDYKLDVDAPFELEKRKAVNGKLERPSYGKNNIDFRMYGSNINRMVAEATKMEDGEEKTALIIVLANQLKKSYVSWNHSSVADELINEHLKKISGGQLEIPEGVKLQSSSDFYVPTTKKKTQKKQQGGKSGYGGRQQKRGKRN